MDGPGAAVVGTEDLNARYAGCLGRAARWPGLAPRHPLGPDGPGLRASGGGGTGKGRGEEAWRARLGGWLGREAGVVAGAGARWQADGHVLRVGRRWVGRLSHEPAQVVGRAWGEDSPRHRVAQSGSQNEGLSPGENPPPGVKPLPSLVRGSASRANDAGSRRRHRFRHLPTSCRRSGRPWRRARRPSRHANPLRAPTPFGP